MLRAIIFILIIINLGCNKKGDLSITESNPTDASVNFTDSLSNKMTNDSLKGEIYPVMLAPSMHGIGIVSIQFPKTGSTKILDRRNNVLIALNFSQGEMSIQDKAYNFSKVSNETLAQVHNFSPWMSALEDEILLFDCISKSGQFYEIIINEKKSIKGRVPISDSNIVFYTWRIALKILYII
jgi:hypothetical protein